MIRIVVTGGRNYGGWQKVNEALDKLHKERGISHLLNGGATGADRLCKNWAERNKIPETTMYADWSQHGRSAGPIRNIKMAETRPDLCVAFPGGNGTERMKKVCKTFGIEVIEIK